MDRTPSTVVRKAQLSSTKRELLARRLRGEEATAADSIPRRTIEAPARISAQQHALWVLHRLTPNLPDYNMTSAFEVEGDLNSKLLERAWIEICQRHKLLCVVFRQDGDTAVMEEMENPPSTTLRVIDVERNKVVDAAIQLGREAFELDRVPGVRLAWIRGDTRQLMVLVLHHIIADNASLSVLWHDLAYAYECLLDNREPDWNVLAVQYDDYAAWQASSAVASEIKSYLAYWRDKLTPLPERLELPIEKRCDVSLMNAGRLISASLDGDLMVEVSALAAQQKVTSQSVYLAAFLLLLHRYAQVDDLAVGLPISMRRHPETRSMVGYFLNTVAFRSQRLSQEETVRTLLQSVGEQVVAAFSRAEVPFEDVVHTLSPKREANRHPIINHMFVYLDDVASFNLGNASMRSVQLDLGVAKFDLTLFVRAEQKQGDLMVEYREGQFTEESIRNFIDHYRQVLRSFVTDPDQRLHRLEYMSSAEQRWLEAISNGSVFKATDHPLVMEKIAEKALEFPKAAAVANNDAEFSYTDLLARTNALASVLTEAGIGRGARVGLFVHRTIDGVAGLLGILRAGAAYVPLDPAYPAERIEWIVNDAGIQLIVTSIALVPSLPVGIDSHICVEEVKAGSSAQVILQEPDDPAYVLYTSGSTGHPKGVVITHHNLRHSTAARSAFYHKVPKRFLLLPGFAFDSSVAGIFWTLCNGGCLYLVSEADLYEPSRLHQIIYDHQITDLLCIPSLYQYILMAEPVLLASLQRVIVAGEVCPPMLAYEHHSQLPSVELYNEYGPTEATVWASVQKITPDDIGDTVPIGRPIPGVRVDVVDLHMRRVPPGFTGECCIAGPTVAAEYLGQPALTAERFDKNGERRYRTGDRVRWRPDGTLEFHGRVDEQIKFRGYRIDPGEIEAALTRLPYIDQATVLLAEEHELEQKWPTNVDKLVESIQAIGDEGISALNEVEQTASSEAFRALPAALRSSVTEERTPTDTASTHQVKGDHFRLDLHEDGSLVSTPRSSQRTWMLNQAMSEFADDLNYLHDLAIKLVPGSESRLRERYPDIEQVPLSDQEIMEDWQLPLMQAMARHVAESHGDVLEIGFGRGVSAEYIQREGVRSHTVVEPNRHSIQKYYRPWRARYLERDIKLVEGRWQDVGDKLSRYDGIFFHAFPLNEEEFIRHILQSITYAEHAMADMVALLRPHGVFTYLSTEIDSLSRRHQRLLFKHFASISLHVEPLQVPHDTRDAWWAPTMVVVKAVKGQKTNEPE